MIITRIACPPPTFCGSFAPSLAPPCFPPPSTCGQFQPPRITGTQGTYRRTRGATSPPIGVMDKGGQSGHLKIKRPSGVSQNTIHYSRNKKRKKYCTMILQQLTLAAHGPYYTLLATKTIFGVLKFFHRPQHTLCAAINPLAMMTALTRRS